MSRKVVFNGVSYTFPDDATDEEIASVLEGSESSGPSEYQSITGVPAVEKAGAFLSSLLPESYQQTIGSHVSKLLGTTDQKEASEKTRDILLDLPIPGLMGSLNDNIESLPAAGASVGALAGGVPAIGGGVIGEGARMGFRKLLGKPPATGFVQDITGMDPESTEAMLMNLGLEGLLASTAGAASKLSKPLERAARRSTQNLVQLPEKIRDMPSPRGGTRGAEMLDRAVDEGIVPALSTRSRQAEISAEKLAESGNRVGALKEKLADELLPEDKVMAVLKNIEESTPPMRPGGMASAGNTYAKTSAQVLDDATAFVSELEATKGGVPLREAVAERTRIADEIASILEGGQESLNKKALSNAGREWQQAINESFPELADENLRYSDLKQINKAITKALHKAEFAGADTAAEGVATGAAAAGRWSVPFMVFGKAAALATAGPVSSMSGSAKRLFSKITASPESMQAWVHLMGRIRPGITEEKE